jgi:hypothetical protein
MARLACLRIDRRVLVFQAEGDPMEAGWEVAVKQVHSLESSTLF